MEGELVVRAASPGLRRYVTRYVGYAERTEIPMRQREPAGPGVVDTPLWRVVSEWLASDWPFGSVEYAPRT
jgi:hypothetical protein